MLQTRLHSQPYWRICRHFNVNGIAGAYFAEPYRTVGGDCVALLRKSRKMEMFEKELRLFAKSSVQPSGISNNHSSCRAGLILLQGRLTAFSLFTKRCAKFQ